MKRGCLVGLSILMIIFIVVPIGALAEEDKIQPSDENIIMDAKIGFDSRYRLGAWTPITVEIENQGEDIDGFIEVTVNSDAARAISYSRPAVVAKDSKKRFILYAQINTIQKKFNVELKEKNKTIKSMEIKSMIPMTSNKYLIGVITDDKPALGYWWRTLGEGSIFANHETVLIKSDEIPDRREVMENFDMLVINNVDTSLMTPKQEEILDQWIYNGGILILGTGPNARKTLSGLKSNIVDVQTGDMFQSDPIEKMDDIKLDLSDITPKDGEKLMEDNEKALVWGLERERGNIFISAFDLGLEPFSSWQGNKTFWETLLVENMDPNIVSRFKDPNGISNMNEKYAGGYNYHIREALGAIKALDVPPYINLIFILVAYILAVGPINYIVLKKLDKREWMWFTIPVFVVLFSVGIYTTGYLQKGNDIIVNTISTIELKGGPSASIDTYAGVFIPQRGDYHISVDSDTLLNLYGESDINDMGYSNPSEQDGRRTIKTKVSQGDPSSITLYDSNVWTMRTLALKDVNTEFGDIKAELFYEDGSIKGTIINNTPYPLEDVIIYTPMGNFERVGNLVSGGKGDVSLLLDDKIPQYSSGYDGIYMMLDELYPYAYSGNNTPSDEERDMRIKRTLLEGLILDEGAQYFSSDGYVNLIGFCDYRPDEKIKVNGSEPDDFQHMGVVASSFDIAYERDGMISLPPGYIKGILNQGLSKDITSADMGFYLEGGQATFDFYMSDYMDYDLSKIEINARLFDGSMEISLYDAEKGVYIDSDDAIDIDKNRGSIIINSESLSRFVSEEGVLRIEIQSKIRDYCNFDTPTLVIEGRKR